MAILCLASPTWAVLPPAGDENISNGGFDDGLHGWEQALGRLAGTVGGTPGSDGNALTFGDNGALMLQRFQNDDLSTIPWEMTFRFQVLTGGWFPQVAGIASNLDLGGTAAAAVGVGIAADHIRFVGYNGPNGYEDTNWVIVPFENDNQWHEIRLVAVPEAKTAFLYVDGEREAVSSEDGDIAAPMGLVYVGDGRGSRGSPVIAYDDFSVRALLDSPLP